MLLPNLRSFLWLRFVCRFSFGWWFCHWFGIFVHFGAILDDEFVYVKLSLTARIIHVADLTKDGPLTPALITNVIVNTKLRKFL